MSRSAHYVSMAELDPAFPVVPLHAIGQPMLFSSGQFSGQTIRTELHEVQQARSGRKSVFLCCCLYRIDGPVDRMVMIVDVF